jgi:GMP synthase-like glutamine amidotransferase
LQRSSHPIRIHAFLHVPFEPLGWIELWARSRGHFLTTTHFFEDPEPWVPDEYDLLVIMGGPMSANDDSIYPWMRWEKETIKKAIDGGKTVLGICLGSQLIANVLGSRVYPNPHKEIGFFPVSLTEEGKKHSLLSSFPETFMAFHWHGETFDLPEGAIHLFRSEGCTQQGFLLDGRVLGLQFHLETTPALMNNLLEHSRKDLEGESPYLMGEEKIREGEIYLPKMHALLDLLLDRLVRKGS